MCCRNAMTKSRVVLNIINSAVQDYVTVPMKNL
jgi:hypothetical protein